MLAYPSLRDRSTSLEAIIRQALLFGELSNRSAETVYRISQQPDVSEDEQRMLAILQEALGYGYVERRE
ncbi:MAG: hypothetical protein VKO01_05135 [Cyanobacteriota bacterium]|jgi:hypothetical protein|nr:hypothetical protein [Cyanobacteriota bacterium]